MSDGLANDMDELWRQLTDLSETYTCYSSALATWAIFGMPWWRVVVDAGLRLGVVKADDLLFGFSHFEPGLARSLDLVRRATDEPDEAVAAIVEESTRSGRVIVAGDGFNLPWHVAYGRKHIPHWFVLASTGNGLTVVDPFTCRNDLGRQEAEMRTLAGTGELAGLAAAIPASDPVHVLREAFALGADDRPLPAASFRWLVHEAPQPPDTTFGGWEGPEAVRRLAGHFRAHGNDPRAYRQADDLWSIARHRAYLAAAASRGDERLVAWSVGHAAPLAARWGHVAPLHMQASLSLDAGRTPTTSLMDVLAELAEREDQAAAAFPDGSATPPESERQSQWDRSIRKRPERG